MKTRPEILKRLQEISKIAQSDIWPSVSLILMYERKVLLEALTKLPQAVTGEKYDD